VENYNEQKNCMDFRTGRCSKYKILNDSTCAEIKFISTLNFTNFLLSLLPPH